MKVISLLNNKGGVRKTTSAVNLAAALTPTKMVDLYDLSMSQIRRNPFHTGSRNMQ